MKVTTALLCDFASVREGLLNVMSGGISRLWRAELPAPLNVSLALMLELHPTELGVPHRLQVIVQDADGHRLAEADAEFRSDPSPHLDPGEHSLLPLALDLRAGLVSTFGTHSVDVVIDGEHRHSLSFAVGPPPMQPPPGV